MKNYKSFLILLTFLMSSSYAFAQDGSAKASEKEKEGPIVRFNGQGRTLLTRTSIDGTVVENDSSTIDKLTDGEFLLDLAVNATPGENTEVQSIIRLRNEFGGFFGAGMSVEVRELWARGIIADLLKYRVGDMDLVMTPYTLYSFEEDATINEPAAFAAQKEVIHYEQFYTDRNTRRLQGAKLDFGLKVSEGIKDINTSAFIARIRPTDFFTTPTRFVTGGQMDINSRVLNDSLGIKGKLGLNLVHTFDDLSVGEANSGIRNTVATISYDVYLLDKSNMSFQLLGETGRSKVSSGTDSLKEIEFDDTFLDIGLKWHLKKTGLSAKVSFIDIGPDFFSMAAQSKRIDYNANKAFYNRLGVDSQKRPVGIFDIEKDRGIYNFRISDQLMAYDPRINNITPFGEATPNRKGLKLDLEYGNEKEALYLRAGTALLSEIRGQGTTELKDFSSFYLAADVNFHSYLEWKKRLRLTLGYGLQNTSRDGLEIEQIDLKSHLLELGLEAELFDKFDLLLGAKALTAEGNEYIAQYGDFNEVFDFPAPYVVDDKEILWAAGFKYHFKKDIYFTLQYQRFESELGADNPNNFDLNQLFVLYNMKF